MLIKEQTYQHGGRAEETSKKTVAAVIAKMMDEGKPQKQKCRWPTVFAAMRAFGTAKSTFHQWKRRLKPVFEVVKLRREAEICREAAVHTQQDVAEASSETGPMLDPFFDSLVDSLDDSLGMELAFRLEDSALAEFPDALRTQPPFDIDAQSGDLDGQLTALEWHSGAIETALSEMWLKEDGAEAAMGWQLMCARERSSARELS